MQCCDEGRVWVEFGSILCHRCELIRRKPMTRRFTYTAGCFMLSLFCSVGVRAADKQMPPYAQGEDGNPQRE
jgi:hypothetical protein